MLQKAQWVQMSYFYPQIISILRQHSDSEHLKTPILLSSLSSVPCFFPALSILLALQKRTKKSRSMSNTNKDHIFSTRLHPVNCEPEGKVQNGAGGGGRLSAKEHLTVGSQQPAWVDKNILLTSKTIPTTKLARDISLAMTRFCFVLPISIIIDTLEAHSQPASSNVVTETWWKHGLTKYTGLTAPWNVC